MAWILIMLPMEHSPFPKLKNIVDLTPNLVYTLTEQIAAPKTVRMSTHMKWYVRFSGSASCAG